MSAEPLLEVAGLSVAYGRVEVLHGMDLRVDEGQVVALVGANGAGKSTLLKTISGLMRPRKGTIRFRGRDVTGRAPYKLVRDGIAHVPEGRRVFPRFDIKENLRVGGYSRSDFHSNGAELDRVIASVPALERRKGSLAGELSGGEQQLLAVQRALMSKPKLLLMDEPSMGLAPVLVDGIFDLIRELNEAGHDGAPRRTERGSEPGHRAHGVRARRRQDRMSGRLRRTHRQPEFSSSYLGV